MTTGWIIVLNHQRNFSMLTLQPTSAQNIIAGEAVTGALLSGLSLLYNTIGGWWQTGWREAKARWLITAASAISGLGPLSFRHQAAAFSTDRHNNPLLRSQALRHCKSSKQLHYLHSPLPAVVCCLLRRTARESTCVSLHSITERGTHANRRWGELQCPTLRTSKRHTLFV